MKTGLIIQWESDEDRFNNIQWGLMKTGLLYSGV